MPKIAEIREIDGDVWVKVGKSGEFETGIALWTPKERDEAIRAAKELQFNLCLEALRRSL